MQARVDALAQVYAHIHQTRMQGLPLLHPGLRVEAVGFELEPPAPSSHAVGVLVTPWFMNLVRLPLSLRAQPPTDLAPQTHEFGATRLVFDPVQEARLGWFETCSLFSPMSDFVDHAAAVATALEVLRQLRSAQAAASQPAAAPLPSRRGFLFGRSGRAMEG